MPKVFVIILNFNGWSDTIECLESLGKVDYSNLEVVLIDNASQGDYRLPTTDYRFKIQIIYNKDNLGFAGGNNQGIKLALEKGTDYVLLLNNDTTVEPDFLKKLVEELIQDESASIAGPLIYFYDSRQATGNKRLIWSAGGRFVGRLRRGELIGYREVDQGEYQASEQVDYISGTCLLIKAEVIKKIGLIPEDYFLYYEDADWGQRAVSAGWRCLLVPQAIIYHKASQSTQEFSYPYIYYNTRNNLIFASRFGLKLLVYPLSAWIFLKQSVKFVLGIRRDWARPMMRGVWDFWNKKTGKLEGYY